MANLVSAAVQNGYGCTVFFEIVEDIDAKGNITIKVGDYAHHTGTNNARKLLQIASDLPVATEGTFSANLETTMAGAGTSAFMRKYLQMYYKPSAARAGNNMEELVDEWGRGRGESGYIVPNEKKLFAVFFGGDFLNETSAAGNPIKYIKYALVSVGNETAGGSFAQNTYMRRNYTLIGQYPDNPLSFELSDAKLAGANIGLKIVTPITLLLEQDVQVDEAQLEVDYEQ